MILDKIAEKNGQEVDAIKKEVILCGFSTGTMIATRLAVAHKDKKFGLLLNIASPLNMRVASKEYLKHLAPIIVPSLIGVDAVLFGAAYGISYAILFHGKHISKLTSLQNSAYIATGVFLLVNILALCFVSVYLWKAAKVGISPENINDLQGQDTHFMQVEGDLYCNAGDTTKAIKGNDNIKFTKIRNNDELKQFLEQYKKQEADAIIEEIESKLGVIVEASFKHNCIAPNPKLIDYALSNKTGTKVTDVNVDTVVELQASPVIS